MTVAARKYSAQDFLQLPEAPKGVRQELARGEIIVSPTPGKSHQYVSVILSSILHRHVKSHDLGIVYTDLDVVFAEDEVRAPDILFYRKERLAQIPDEHPEIPPDLAIEIISPSDPKYDRVAKFTLYQQKGVRHYWIVDPPARTVEAYSLENGRYVSAGRGSADQTVNLPPFPDLPIPLAELWHP